MCFSVTIVDETKRSYQKGCKDQCECCKNDSECCLKKTRLSEDNSGTVNSQNPFF